MINKDVRIQGVWLRNTMTKPLDEIEVLVEIDGKWRKAIVELNDGPISHICETSGIENAPFDILTN